MQVTYNGTGPVSNGEVWSAFHLAFNVNEGNTIGCADTMLEAYGQGIVAGVGPMGNAASS